MKKTVVDLKTMALPGVEFFPAPSGREFWRVKDEAAIAPFRVGKSSYFAFPEVAAFEATGDGNYSFTAGGFDLKTLRTGTTDPWPVRPLGEGEVIEKGLVGNPVVLKLEQDAFDPPAAGLTKRQAAILESLAETMLPDGLLRLLPKD